MTHIRAAEERDLPAILDIFNDAITTSTAVFHYDPHTLEMRREWYRAKQAANDPVFVAEIDDSVVGFATYGPFRPWPAYQHTVEHSVYVARHAWRCGVARALMDALLADARRRGYHAVIGGIVADNIASLRLHESLGFVKVAHFREVGYKFERWLDLKFVELLLTPGAEGTNERALRPPRVDR
jgi:L-amino acid N-acyltransferase YncA